MMNATVEHDKVKSCILNKNKDKIRKLETKFKSACSYTNDYCSVSNCNTLVTEIFDVLVNPTFIQNLNSTIDHDHSGDNKIKG